MLHRAEFGQKVWFGEFVLDSTAGELYVNGTKTILQDKPLGVLVALLERPRQLVSRDELKARLWPSDTFVDFDRSLNKAVQRLREALQDSADHPRFVETVSRRGYRFIATLDGTGQVPVQNPLPKPVLRSWRRLGWVLIAGCLLTVATAVYIRQRTGRGETLTQRTLTANPSDNPVQGAVVSPDGKLLAYSDDTGVWLKSIDGGELRLIAGTNGFTVRDWFPQEDRL
ncbi:MAG TPA: winged helix-turn-helix domain-containing protein, partial [Terriglobales bacterium]|nr:winged helix-turn-helix domain-containing protein [Terriglobales bacterium]